MAIQHAAVSVVGTDGLTTRKPPRRRSYDDTALPSGAPANASDTMACRSSSMAKPNGVTPAETTTVGLEARPRPSTVYTSKRWVAFSATTRWRPSGVKDTSAGPAAGELSGRTELRIGERWPAMVANPAMLPLPP